MDMLEALESADAQGRGRAGGWQVADNAEWPHCRDIWPNPCLWHWRDCANVASTFLMVAICMHSPLDGLGLRQLYTCYGNLPAVPASRRQGDWRAVFTGPWWLRLSAAPAIALSGMPGWFGKRFATPETAVNLLRSAEGLREVLSMRCEEQPSWHDGRTCSVLLYGRKARLPWRWVRDELRQLDEQHWLCMTYVDLPLLRALGCPFMLVRDNAASNAG